MKYKTEIEAHRWAFRKMWMMVVCQWLPVAARECEHVPLIDAAGSDAHTGGTDRSRSCTHNYAVVTVTAVSSCIEPHVESICRVILRRYHYERAEHEKLFVLDIS